MLSSPERFLAQKIKVFGIFIWIQISIALVGIRSILSYSIWKKKKKIPTTKSDTDDCKIIPVQIYLCMEVDWSE